MKLSVTSCGKPTKARISPGTPPRPADLREQPRPGPGRCGPCSPIHPVSNPRGLRRALAMLVRLYKRFLCPSRAPLFHPRRHRPRAGRLPPAGTGAVPGAAARTEPHERVQAQAVGAEGPVSHGNRSWHRRGNQRQSDSIQDVRPAGSAAHTPTSHRCPAQKGFIYPVESKFRVCSCLPSDAAAGSSRKLQLNTQICT